MNPFLQLRQRLLIMFGGYNFKADGCHSGSRQQSVDVSTVLKKSRHYCAPYCVYLNAIIGRSTMFWSPAFVAVLSSGWIMTVRPGVMSM